MKTFCLRAGHAWHRCTLGAKRVLAADQTTQPLKRRRALICVQAFVRGVLCNWLVCLAVYMASATTTLPGKFLAILPPISMFIALGLEHSVANMFIIPAGIFAAGEVAWADCLLSNLLPVTLGNTVGGALCVAFMYSSVYSNVAWRSHV
jgi:formate transporter